MSNSTSSAPPAIVAFLGYGGLIPFMGLALAGLWGDIGRIIPWHTMLLSYGAVILTFVGALHWGFAMILAELPTAQGSKLFAWSVIPSLMAWAALSLPSPFAEAVLIAGFVAHFWRDRSLAGIAPLPAWYLPLRFRLSLMACACLGIGAVAG